MQKLIIVTTLSLFCVWIVQKRFFELMKDIRRHQVEAGSLLWMSPVELAGDWRCSILVPGATNWHMLLVCCKPPTRHTCYMCVAKNGISAPLQNMVWRQQRVPLSTCLPRKQPTHTCSRVFVHEDGLKDNSSAKITCTDTHCWDWPR